MTIKENVVWLAVFTVLLISISVMVGINLNVNGAGSWLLLAAAGYVPGIVCWRLAFNDVKAEYGSGMAAGDRGGLKNFLDDCGVESE